MSPRDNRALLSDRVRLWSAAPPFPIRWAPEPLRVGQIIRVAPSKSGGLVPKVVVRAEPALA